MEIPGHACKIYVCIYIYIYVMLLFFLDWQLCEADLIAHDGVYVILLV